MRARVAMLVAAVALTALSAASEAQGTRLPWSALVPNAVAFDTRLHGVLGTGSESCGNQSLHCRLQGTISVTSNGGRTWHVVLRTKRPVVGVVYFHDTYEARLEDSHVLWSDSAALRWHRSRALLRHFAEEYCPKGWTPGITADIVDTNIDVPWSICMGEPGAGNQAKAVYRGTKRVAFTPFASHGGYGGISVYGYPIGIAGSDSGFGVIWESRGTLYVTRDGGHHWHALPKIARPEVDFGLWADVGVYPGTAFVLLLNGGADKRRLIETTDEGRTWRVVHRWG